MPTRLRHLPEWLRIDRAVMREKLLRLIPYCEHPECRNSDQSDLVVHEGLISGNDLFQIDNQFVWGQILLNPINLLVLHNSPCHLNKRPDREACLDTVMQRPITVYTGLGWSSAWFALSHFYSVLESLEKRGQIKIRLPRPINLNKWSSL